MARGWPESADQQWAFEEEIRWRLGWALTVREGERFGQAWDKRDLRFSGEFPETVATVRSALIPEAPHELEFPLYQGWLWEISGGEPRQMVRLIMETMDDR